MNGSFQGCLWLYNFPHKGNYMNQLSELLLENENLKKEIEKLKSIEDNRKTVDTHETVIETKNNQELSTLESAKDGINKYIPLALVTEAPAGPVLARIQQNPEIFAFFVRDMRKVTESLKLLDKWKKMIFYGKVNPTLKIKKTWWDKVKGLFSKEEKLTPFDLEMVRILHGSMGLATESGELLEAIDKFLTGKGFDKVNGKEELGDIGWYQNLLFDVFGTTAPENFELWYQKLKLRFGDKFTEHAAKVRNLEAERSLLEK